MKGISRGIPDRRLLFTVRSADHETCGMIPGRREAPRLDKALVAWSSGQGEGISVPDVRSRIVGIVRIDDGAAVDWFERPDPPSLASEISRTLSRSHPSIRADDRLFDSEMYADCQQLRCELDRLFRRKLEAMNVP